MIYLDNGATSCPKPKEVIEAVTDAMENSCANPGRAANKASLKASKVIFNCRETLADFLNVPAKLSHRVVFTKNATESINMGLKGIVKTKTHVITTHFEHNSLMKTLRSLEETHDIEITKLKGKDGIISVEEVQNAIKDNTSVIAITHASNLFGTIQPITEIGKVAKEFDLLFFVDCAQTAGLIEIDVEESNIDMLAGTGHKSLQGPQGTGFLFIRDTIELPQFIHGGTGDSKSELEIPDKLETGTLNTPGIAGLLAGIELVKEKTLESIRKHEMSLVELIIDEFVNIDKIKILGSLDIEKRVSLISFTIDNITPNEAEVYYDEKYDIMVRSGLHCTEDGHALACTFPEGAIRVSPGLYTTKEEIQTFIKATKELIKEKA